MKPSVSLRLALASAFFLIGEASRAEILRIPSPADRSSGTVTLEGELLWEDLEGGMWNMREGRELYDLHGDVPFEDGDWVRVTGSRQDKLICMHLRGTVFKVSAMEKIAPPQSASRWLKFQRSAVCYDAEGREVKVLHLSRRKKALASTVEDERAEQALRYKDLAIGPDGGFACMISLDNAFRFYDRQGALVWEAPQTGYFVVSSSGNFVALARRAPGDPAYRLIEDSPLFASIHTATGALVMSFEEAPLLARDSIHFTPSGRYGYVKVYRTIEGTIFFDALKGSKKIYEGLGIPKIDDAGTYRVLGKTGAFSDVKEIYRGRME